MRNSEIKIVKSSTVPTSLNLLLKGQLKYLNQFYEVIGVSGQDKNLDMVASREGIKTISVKMERRISLLQDLVSLIHMYNVLKKEKPTIVHSITPKAGLMSMLAGKLAGVPIRIHTFTGLFFPTQKGFFQKLLIWMDKLICYCATHVFPEGQGVKNDLVAYNITSKPLEIIANGNINGVDTEYFDPSKVIKADRQALMNSLDIQPKDFVFVFIGRLVDDKGVNELVTSFSSIDQPNVKLLLVGPFEEKIGPIKDSVKTEIQNNDKIITVGWQPDTRIYLSISDVLILPSYREGFPNVVLEAGAMGLPSLVTDVNGSNEIIEEGYNGLIVPVKNVNELLKKMRYMISDAELIKKMKSNARKNILDNYDRRIVWNAIKQKYDSLIVEYTNSK